MRRAEAAGQLHQPPAAAHSQEARPTAPHTASVLPGPSPSGNSILPERQQGETRPLAEKHVPVGVMEHASQRSEHIRQTHTFCGEADVAA